ncbi:MAG TPA: Rieske 2Fe-2S domain-containing protein, partial [Polyangiaceae bacterium]|nr:Rieske 2Fe-2S domain-containing protein [Polyangiaceae bacterium]
MPPIDVARADEFPPGSTKLVIAGPGEYVGVYNCGGSLYAIEDRCSHDDGPLCEGEWDEDLCRVVCPRHGSSFDLSSGRPLGSTTRTSSPSSTPERPTAACSSPCRS